MSAHAARRLLPMAENLTQILAIELLAGCQGCGDFHAPLASSVLRWSVSARGCARRCRTSTTTATWPPTSRKLRVWCVQANHRGGGRSAAATLDLALPSPRKTGRGRLEKTMTRIDNARRIRAPRGTEISAKSWLTEAPLRMLMNNLDAEVAEKPSELVVYGGIGRAARDWESFDRIVASLRKLDADGDAAGAVGQAGRRLPHACRCPARAGSPNSNIVPHWATLGAFRRSRPQGPDDVRADDGGLLDLHRQPGHRAGHLRRRSWRSAGATTAAAWPAGGS